MDESTRIDCKVSYYVINNHKDTVYKLILPRVAKFGTHTIHTQKSPVDLKNGEIYGR